MPFLFRATPRHGYRQRASSLGSPTGGRAFSRPIRRHPRRYETTAARDRNSTIRAICAGMSQSVESLPLPDDRVLAQWAATLNKAGHWAFIYDVNWRLV